MHSPVTNNFDDKNDFEGWNCGEIQACGKFGNICGGFDVKGRWTDIKKTFEVPEDLYRVKLTFIKLDTWLVKCV